MPTKQDISIVLITYNHEKFIRDAINGILIQDLSDVLEIIISDDASTDNTCSIINDFHFPESCAVRKVFRTENVGMNKNVLEALKLAKGEFVAFFEGDDFWTDPLKLKRQKQFLLEKGDFTFCCTNTTVIDNDGIEVKNAWPNKSEDFEVSKRMLGINLPLPTCSIFFRLDAISGSKNIFRELNSIPLPDYFLKSWLLVHGKGYYFKEKMAVRRLHHGGVYTSMPTNKKRRSSKITKLNFLFCLLKRFKLFSALLCFKNILIYSDYKR